LAAVVLNFSSTTMWFLYCLSWASTVLQICFVTLAIAAGLYYLAELVEEYTVMTAKVIRWMVICTLLVYICLFLFENLPTSLIACGIIAQVAHLALLTSFPFFSVTSASFILSVIMVKLTDFQDVDKFIPSLAQVLVNHYLAFSHFGENYYPFSEVMAYFTICLWLVPFSFFVSLSANENVLPTMNTMERRPLLSQEDNNDVVSNYFSKKQKGVGLLSVFNKVKDSVTPGKSQFKAY